MRGINNLGNTCYFSAALQCLLFCPPLANYLLLQDEVLQEDLYKKRLNASAFAQGLADLAREHWRPGGAGPLDPTPLKATFGKLYKSFANCQPQDAHEALVLMLKALHEGLARTTPVPGSRALDGLQGAAREAWLAGTAKSYSIVTDIFQGQLLSSLEGSGYSAAGYEPFMSLSLPVAACDSLQQALDAYLADELIEDFKPGPVTKSTTLTHAPSVLVLHLKRFDGPLRKPGGGKLDKFVDYSLELQLAGARYACFAQILHSGGPLDGHYSALACTRGVWYYLDDCSSVRVSNLNSLIRKECYVLLYVRQPQPQPQPR